MGISLDREALAYIMVTKWKIYYAQRTVGLDGLDKNDWKGEKRSFGERDAKAHLLKEMQTLE